MAGKTKVDKGLSAPNGVLYPKKVEPPAVNGSIVHRGRLLDALSALTREHVAVVSAPAGYGKTTLLADFAASWPDTVCWLSLDERDADPATFLAYFLEAGRHSLPGFGAKLAAGLNNGAKYDPQTITDLLVSAVSDGGRPLLFVIDDFQHIDGSPALRQAIDGWLTRLPDNCHVVISSRTYPQLSVLPSLAVRQDASLITVRDFSFTCDEVVHLFRDVVGKEITLDDSQHLANLTEGWAGALVLLGDRFEPGKQIGPLEQLSATDTLFQYISVEQVQWLPEETQEFMLASSVLLTLDIDTANELLGIDDSQANIDALLERNLCLPAETEGVYRYHRLLRAALVSRLRSVDGKRFKELNVRAAEIRERTQRWEDAVYHLIQAGDWSRVVELTERVGRKMFEEGRWDTLSEWLDAIPPKTLASEPRLLLWKARTYHYLNQIDRALALVAQAAEAFEARKDQGALAEALMVKGTCLRVKGDYEEARDALLEARRLMTENGSPDYTLAAVRKELGMTLGRFGAMNEAIEELTAVVDYYEAQGDTYNIAHSITELAACLGYAGLLSEMIVYQERARGLWEELNNDHFLVQVLNNLGMAYYLQGDLAKAETMFTQGLERARAINNIKEQVYLTTCLADLKKDSGDYKTALDMYSAALDDAWAVTDAYIRVYLMNATADAYRLLGELTNADSWAGRARVEAEQTGGAMELGVCLMTAGLVKWAQDEHKEAVELLDKAIPFLDEKGAKRELITAYFHLASVYFSMKRKSLALKALEEAAKRVEGLGYDHFLLIEATRNPALVQYASANKVADGYYARMLKTVKSTGKSADVAEEGAMPTDANAVSAFGFGNPRVEVGGQEITDLEWRSEKSKEMFFFFLCNRRPLRKEDIVTALWPDMPDEKTTSAFHSNMYRLRKALYQEVIAKDSGRYVLDPQRQFVFDVEEFQAELKKADAVKGTPGAITHLERARALYKGQFTPDFYSEWAETLRWQFEEQNMSLLGALAAAYNEAGEYKKSADVCQRIIELDEFNEAAWYRLMANYVQSGQTEAAKYCYDRYVKALAKDDMDDEAPEFDELVKEMSAGKLRV